MAAFQFDTPGSLRDAPNGSPFYRAWHDRLDAMLGTGTDGPGGVGRTYNPARRQLPVAAGRSLVWMGFPRRLLVTRHRDDRAEALRLADDKTLSTRDGQEEYLEWRTVKRDGKIVKVTFTTEVREYWQTLYESHKDVVLKRYQELVGDATIAQADLEDGAGNYNLRNPWNTDRGIVHLIVDNLQNSLGAAVGLAMGCANLTGGQPHFRDNYELLDQRPQEQTSADPRVTIDGNTLVRRNLSVTLREPIGVYMAAWDDTGWTRPNGRPVGDYWKVIRGKPGAALRLEYEVPVGEGFVVGDIRIGGRPIEFGGQIAEHITVMAGAVAG